MPSPASDDTAPGIATELLVGGGLPAVLVRAAVVLAIPVTLDAPLVASTRPRSWRPPDWSVAAAAGGVGGRCELAGCSWPSNARNTPAGTIVAAATRGQRGNQADGMACAGRWRGFPLTLQKRMCSGPSLVVKTAIVS